MSLGLGVTVQGVTDGAVGLLTDLRQPIYELAILGEQRYTIHHCTHQWHNYSWNDGR